LATLSDENRTLGLKIAGEIILSDAPSVVMRKWREKLSISQANLAKELGLSSSVISDYESGRRKNPGVHFVRRFIQALLEIDKRSGRNLALKSLESPPSYETGILDIVEFPFPVSTRRMNRAISGQILTCQEPTRKVRGYTVIDNEVAVTSLSRWAFLQIFGKTAERALVFTNIKPEKAPMLSLRFSLLKPTVLVYHLRTPGELDVRLAENEGVTLIYSKAKGTESLLKSLRKLYAGMVKVK